MKQKSRITAALLAIFLGIFGIHKLYLGRVGAFIGFMILFVVSIGGDFPITAFIGIIQGLILFFMSDADFDKKYNKGLIAERRGPLDVRREKQLERYQQLPGQKSIQNNNSTISAQSQVKAAAFKNSGIKKYKDFDLEDAIQDFKSGLELTPNDPALHFNIACAYSLVENKALTFKHLMLAVANGMKDVNRILTHEDLAYIRIQPEFESFRISGFKTINPANTQEIKEVVTNKLPDETESLTLPDDETLLNKLNKLSELREKGVISEQEFEFERKKVMRQ
jgi:TM2 domain-containing membrane protein YozV